MVRSAHQWWGLQTQTTAALTTWRMVYAVQKIMFLANITSPISAAKLTQNMVGLILRILTYCDLNHSQYPHRTGHTCPQTHPIPCMRGSYCTVLQPALLDNCTPSDIADGVCCPDDAVPCREDDPNYLCRANPYYGRVLILLKKQQTV